MEKSKNSELTTIKLDTGKEISFRNLKIRDMNMAAKSAARESGDNPWVFQMAVQQELLKSLMVEVDGVKLSGSQKENLDDIFTPGEYMGVNEFMGQLMGKSKVVETSIASNTGNK